MTDLASRIERGEATDEEVLLARGWGNEGQYWWRTADPLRRFHESAVPRPLDSVDDALRLVPEGWRATMQYGDAYDDGEYMGKSGCQLFDQFSSGPITAQAFAETLPLAICAAIVRSL